MGSRSWTASASGTSTAPAAAPMRTIIITRMVTQRQRTAQCNRWLRASAIVRRRGSLLRNTSNLVLCNTVPYVRSLKRSADRSHIKSPKSRSDRSMSTAYSQQSARSGARPTPAWHLPSPSLLMMQSVLLGSALLQTCAGFHATSGAARFTARPRTSQNQVVMADLSIESCGECSSFETPWLTQLALGFCQQCARCATAILTISRSFPNAPQA